MRSPETYEAVRSLRVVRAYRDEPIPDDLLDAILEAGRWTGSSKNQQRWAFVVVDGDGRDRLATAGRFTDPIRDSAVSIALVKTDGGNDFDIGRLAQNLMLAASAHGVGSCPVTLHDTDRAREVLGLPDDAECRYAIALGFPDTQEERDNRAARRARGAAGRIPLDDLAHRGRWDD